MAQVIKLKRSSTQGAEPTTSDLALGEVGINTYDGKMFIKKDDGTASLVDLGTGGGGESVYTKTTVTAAANQTTVTGLTYTAGMVDVYLNGARLVVGTDVTATNGTSIVLAAGAAYNDVIQIIAFKAAGTFTPASPTFTGTLTAPTINASTALQISGVAITSTASELNLLDGVSTTAAELNILDGATVTTAELNILDGVTATASEINSVTTKAPTASPTFTGTATAPTVNASTALQIGGVAVTSTAAELNYVDGVTSNIQTQLDAIAPGHHVQPFTANGAIAANKPVILQPDGKAAEVSVANRTRTQASPSYIETATIDNTQDQRDHHGACWETNGSRFLVTTESGIRLGPVSGTGSNTTIVMGNETVTARADGQGYYTHDIIADPNNSNRFLIMYSYSYELYFRILRIIGEGGGAKVDLKPQSPYNDSNNPKISQSHTTGTSSHCLAWDKDSGKAVAIYCTEYDSNNRLTCKVVSITADVVVSAAAGITFAANPTIEYRRAPCIAQDPNTPGLFVAAWRQSGSAGSNAHKGCMRALKLASGTLTSPGNITPIPNSACTAANADGSQIGISGHNIVFDSTTARQLVVIESGASNTRSWIANVPDASGAFTGNITFQSNTPVTATSDRTCTPAISGMDQTASGEDGKYLMTYYTLGTQGSPTGDWYYQVGSLDGTTMTWSTREAVTNVGCDIQYSSANPAYAPNAHIGADPSYAGRAVSIIYDNEGTNTKHYIHIVEVAGEYNTTKLSGNFIGIAESAISNAASGNVVIRGGVATLSSLTADTTYYVQRTGDINTTSTGTEIGKAISTTKLLLKGL